MFAITTQARAHLAQILAAADTPDEDEPVIRMFLGQENLGLALDLEKPEDSKYDHEGNTVLVVDEKLTQALEGKTLDVMQTDEGESLTLR
jgi:Fe-S cluster assembly iron-binding protein IscA